MIPLITTNQEQILSLCIQYKVKRLWLFGSALDDNVFGPSSDLDFLYETDDEKMTDREYVDFPIMLKKRLEKLFDRSVDLIPDKHFENPFLRESILKNRYLIVDYDKSHREISV